MFSKRLVEIRKKKNINQDDFAMLLGVTRSAVSLWEIGKREPDFDMLKLIAEKSGVTVDYLLGRVSSPTDSLVPTTTEPIDPSVERIGYTDPSPAAQKIADAIDSDPELLAFWKDVSQRPDLQLLCRQTKSMTPETIRKVMRIIKAIEEEEANED